MARLLLPGAEFYGHSGSLCQDRKVLSRIILRTCGVFAPFTGRGIVSPHFSHARIFILGPPEPSLDLRYSSAASQGSSPLYFGLILPRHHDDTTSLRAHPTQPCRPQVQPPSIGTNYQPHQHCVPSFQSTRPSQMEPRSWTPVSDA
jgi:hypothetical protein